MRCVDTWLTKKPHLRSHHVADQRHRDEVRQDERDIRDTDSDRERELPRVLLCCPINQYIWSAISCLSVTPFQWSDKSKCINNRLWPQSSYSGSHFNYSQIKRPIIEYLQYWLVYFSSVCPLDFGQNSFKNNIWSIPFLFSFMSELKLNLTVCTQSFDVYRNDWLMATHLSSIGHLHAVQRTSSWSCHFTHKADLR